MADEKNNEKRWETPYRSTPPDWGTHPRKRMLMTPLLVVFGGIFAFAVPTIVAAFFQMAFFSPPVSDNWSPYDEQAARGREIYVANGCVYCHSGYTRPQDVRHGLYYTYSRISLPGDFATSDEAPNLWGTARIGPDLSQEGGLHPDDWHRAHFSNPRFTTPNSIMPSFNFLSDQEIEDLIAFVQQRGGKSALLRFAGQKVAKEGMLAAMSLPQPPASSEAEEMTLADVAEGAKMGGFMQMDMGGDEDGDMDGDMDGDGDMGGDEDMGGDGDMDMDGDEEHEALLHPHDAYMLNFVDRTYWVMSNPLPVTKNNLLRGRMIYQERCVGCHGQGGAGVSQATRFLRPVPFDFTNEEESAEGVFTSEGSWYYKVLRGVRGTDMENFGTRLKVDDIWRVVMFLKTIPNGGLVAGQVPTVDQYIQWKPPRALLDYMEENPAEESLDLTMDSPQTDPFLLEAHRIMNGMSPGHSFHIEGFGDVSLERFARLIEEEYNRLLDEGWDAFMVREGHPVPPASQKEILPAMNEELR